MIVTDKQYFMEKKLIHILDLCIDRCTGKKKLDNLMIVDGDEGFGKSTLAIACAYYVADKTGRPFSVDNVFFDIDEVIKFAATTKDQIIIWDEAALGGMAMDWRSELQQKLIKLMMTSRKKRHFFFFNIPKFFKLNEYIILDRSIGMLHVYARNENELGRFCYFKKKGKEFLYNGWRKNKARNYAKFKNFWGTFPNVLHKLIDEEAYELKKDKAIESICDDEKNKVLLQTQKNYFKLKHKVANSFPTQKEACDVLGIPKSTIQSWANLHEKYEFIPKPESYRH